LVGLRRKNNELLSRIQEMEKTIAALKKAKNNEAQAAGALSPTEKKRIEKMLDSAALAENENKKEAAIWYYEKVLEDDPDNNVALAKLAYAKAEKGENEEAVRLINRALAKNPDDLELLQTLAVCYSRMKKYYKALGAAAKANAINPRNPVTQRYLGIICSHLGWVEAAKRQFGSSFKLDPTSAETAYNAAVLLLTTKGGLPEAKLWYDKAVQLGAQPDPKIEELFKGLKKNGSRKEKK
jgi:Flp pilus assembly protein TadD